MRVPAPHVQRQFADEEPTDPEDGRVSYSYNSYGKVATRTDAKGQVVVYSYDGYARLIKVQRYSSGTSNAEKMFV